ncbi:MAG: FAD-dependent oxidoreductase, partial [Parcubacteria group bacterium]
EIQAHSVILATGACARWLNLKNEKRLIGKGVSSCATCDGFFFKGKETVVVGGGDTAIEEALFLTKFATKVTVVHRRDTLRASKIMQERVKKNPKISFIWNSEIRDVLGKDKVDGVKLYNIKTGKEQVFKADGLFIAIGHTPNTLFLKDQVEVDKKGYVVVKNNTHTNVEGVFVAGDVQDHRYRQAVTAAGLGCMAGMDAEKWLTEHAIVTP